MDNTKTQSGAEGKWNRLIRRIDYFYLCAGIVGAFMVVVMTWWILSVTGL